MRYGRRSASGGKPLRKVDTEYVSEFTDFITHFLEDHPEEEEERRKGRALYWDHHIDLSTLEQKDNVPDDRYGFDYSAWRTGNDPGHPSGKS
jgi:hypothetical protein